eukprot:14632865-Ditylum_brightwellii.AAC.1
MTGNIERLGVCGHCIFATAAAVLNVAQVAQNGQEPDASFAGVINYLSSSIKTVIPFLGQI